MADVTIAGLLYNLYSDKLLGFDLVPKHIYEMQDSFYPTVKNKYGVPLDTRAQYTKGKLLCPFIASQKPVLIKNFRRLGSVHSRHFISRDTRHVLRSLGDMAQRDANRQGRD